MAFAPLSQTLVLTEDGSTVALLDPVVIPSGPITVPPSPATTYANSTTVFANQDGFAATLADLQQGILALDPATSTYLIDFGSGPDTPTGDTVFEALTKLQSWIAAIEAADVPPAYQPALKFNDPRNSMYLGATL